jgi:sigma-B regulation protein RsbQ
MVFAHGFGCDQQVWRWVTPAFADDFRVVVYDHVGSGRSDSSAYDPQRYGTLHGYAQDLLQICARLDIARAVFIGHSVGAVIGMLAAAERPDLFSRLIMVAPSPRYIDDDADGYIGGFNRAVMETLLDTMDANYLGWSAAVAPVIMGSRNRPELITELTDNFCNTDPDIARQFARVTFLSDNRADLARVRTPSLVLQCTDDAIAPDPVGVYMADRLPASTLVRLSATGHCPILSAPAETAAAIITYLVGERPDPMSRSA